MLQRFKFRLLEQILEKQIDIFLRFYKIGQQFRRLIYPFLLLLSALCTQFALYGGVSLCLRFDIFLRFVFWYAIDIFLRFRYFST